MIPAARIVDRVDPLFLEFHRGVVIVEIIKDGFADASFNCAQADAGAFIVSESLVRWDKDSANDHGECTDRGECAQQLRF